MGTLHASSVAPFVHNMLTFSFNKQKYQMTFKAYSYSTSPAIVAQTRQGTISMLYEQRGPCDLCKCECCCDFQCDSRSVI